jgi:hypothetical protein
MSYTYTVVTDGSVLALSPAQAAMLATLVRLVGPVELSRQPEPELPRWGVWGAECEDLLGCGATPSDALAAAVMAALELGVPR